MKKLFFLTAISLMATVGMSAREHARFVAPKTVGEITKVLRDSSLCYEGDKQTEKPGWVYYYTYDEQLRLAVFEQWNNTEIGEVDTFMVVSREITSYNAEGQIQNWVRHSTDKGDVVLFKTDSTDWVYGEGKFTKTEWEMDFETSQWAKAYSYESTLNDNDSVILTFMYEWKAGQSQLLRKDTFIYDADNHLIQNLTFEWKNTAWVDYSRTIYEYKKGLCVSMMEEKYDDPEWDLEVSHVYVYNESDQMVADSLYFYTGPCEEYDTFEYDQDGNMSKMISHKQNSKDKSWKILYSEIHYYSEHSMPSAIKDIESLSGATIRNSKFIRNGQMLIERNGIRYNAQGQVVEK